MKITKEQLENLIQTYLFKYQAADSLGVSVYYVDKALKKYGMTYPRANRLGDKIFYCHPEITKEWMIENWVNTGKSMMACTIILLQLFPARRRNRLKTGCILLLYLSSWNVNFKNINKLMIQSKL